MWNRDENGMRETQNSGPGVCFCLWRMCISMIGIKSAWHWGKKNQH